MLEDLKKVLGFNNDEFDDLITNYIETAKMDLEMAGISKSKIIEEDKLIYSAIITFVKSKFDIENSEMFTDSYLLQKEHLRHYSDYIE